MLEDNSGSHIILSAQRNSYHIIVDARTSACTLAAMPDQVSQVEAMQDRYTPGHTSNAVDFMSRRTLDSHGAFFIPLLADGLSVLDCGSGPGTITCDIAGRTPLGRVVGVDYDKSQVRLATDIARSRNLRNVEFRLADVYELPFQPESFDAVFSHALLEHLGEPCRAITEFRRVLRPGGVIGLSSPDWGGFLLAPTSKQLITAIGGYKELLISNDGDPYAGRKLGKLLENASFQAIEMKARYEMYESLESIGEYLALQLENAGEAQHATTLREWASTPTGMFAQAWVSCTGRKPPSTHEGKERPQCG